MNNYENGFKSSLPPKSITYQGYRYSYKAYGQVDPKIGPLVVIGGVLHNISSWNKSARYFSRKTLIVLVDLPGTGESDLLPCELGLDFLSHSILRIVEKLALRNINLVSASYGTPIAYSFAKRHPILISHLILGGTMKEIPQARQQQVLATIDYLLKNRMDQFCESVIDILLNHKKKSDKYSFVVKVLRKVLFSMSRNDKLKYIENTRRIFLHAPLQLDRSPDVPTLVFTGENDEFTKPEYCREIAKSFNRSVFTTIKNADHMFYLEEYDTTQKIVECFIEGKEIEAERCNEIEYLGPH